ncbi:valine--tRNA ligase [Candidatus Wolfebacteria bacterium]|nr:valine--tRNA ligase [Candidatus Wolfebacteria bacterium]
MRTCISSVIINIVHDKFLKPYDPVETEDRIYKLWEESGLFNPDVCIEKGVTRPDAKPFSIALPPPNVTGTLHVGHTFMLAIQDSMVRFNRMVGNRTLWLPGTDHAAIATESVVARALAKKGIQKHDLGREAFLGEINRFAAESHDTIVSQLKKMGSSLDWSREAFTLDRARQEAVYEAFKRMYDAELIYRGERIVNWDPKNQTTVSDDEIEYREETVPFYYFSYGPFTIGTARPETKFGDKYVVMHPDDKRYAQYKHGEMLDVEWINGPITATIIKDEAIDMKFGTGVMTITPAHSYIDFDIAMRHNLEREQIIDTHGRLLPIAGEFADMNIADAREKIVEKLQSKGLVVKIDTNYTHNIATSQRGGALIEPQVMRQWFVDVNKPIAERNGTSLKELMRETVAEKKVSILPERFEKVYFHWIDNLRDWCISRQIWYGHRIPVWYRGEETYVGTEPPRGDAPASAKASAGKWEQDPDTLDTWFSSGLWTFSTLGWPHHTPDLTTYHPTSVLETGYDILFFWVARMILMSRFLLDDVPFRTVYLHGMVLDKNGKKMSKSNPETAVDPLGAIREYGADAVRMAMIINVGPGQNTMLSEDKIRAYKKFANKLWNIARFVLTSTDDFEYKKDTPIAKADQVHLDNLNALVDDTTSDMKKLNMHLASERLYHYVWHTFADGIIEESKETLAGTDVERKQSRQYLLLEILATCLQLLHPFMPFITEEVWHELPQALTDSDLLMVSRWPSGSLS